MDKSLYFSGRDYNFGKKTYRMAGVQGTLCSRDTVHVAWDKCPSALRFDLSGKEGYPTLAMIFCVSHTTQTMNVHRHKRVAGTRYDEWEGGFKGATNDKTIVRTDKMINAIATSDLFKSFPFKVYINENFETME
jgi:hypothetical protein